MPSQKANPLSPQKFKYYLKAAILLLIIGSVIGFLSYQTISPGKAALLIEASPEALVYIDGEQKGKTPLELELETKEVVLTLAPEGQTPPFYETKLKLAKGVKTIVRRKFEVGIEKSSGLIISFERKLSQEAQIAVVTSPDKAQVFIDNEFVGLAPLKLSTSQAEHSLKISQVGFVSQEFLVETISGYAVTAIIDLAEEYVATPP